MDERSHHDVDRSAEASLSSREGDGLFPEESGESKFDSLEHASEGQDEFSSQPPPLPAVAVARLIRFCGRCGASWQPAWEQCESCAARTAATSVATFGSRAATSVPGDIPSPGIRPAITLYFALFAVSLFSMIAVMAGGDALTIDFAGSAAMSSIVIIWCIVAGRGTLSSMFRLASPGWFAAAVGGAFATCAVAFLVIESLHRGLGVEKLGYSEEYFAAGYGVWMVVMMICIQPAIFEELAFRGVVLTSLRPALSDVEAVLVSAMLFMTLHLSVAAFPHTFAMGVVAGFMRLRSRSLLPGILLHFIHNSIVIFAEIKYGI